MARVAAARRVAWLRVAWGDLAAGCESRKQVGRAVVALTLRYWRRGWGRWREMMRRWRLIRHAAASLRSRGKVRALRRWTAHAGQRAEALRRMRGGLMSWRKRETRQVCNWAGST